MIKLERNLVALDLETTGIERSSRIVQIGTKLYTPEGEVRDWWSLVNPGIPIPKGASDKHGIWDNDLLEKPRFEEIAPTLAQLFVNADIAGYNVKFDCDILNAEFKRVGVSTPVLTPSLDALRLWHLVRPRTLSHASREFLGKEHAGAHDAMADINVTMDVLDVIMQDPMFDGLGMTQLRCLQWPVPENALDQQGKIAWMPNGVAMLTFGKHKGEPFEKVPRNYFDYLAKQDFADDAKAIFRAAAEGRYPVKS